ncbi:MAG: hypothetical protein KY460_09980 [Actinobacteria bacterium]|nr:hypothetical protein [Actinomycetota bacterium]
MRNDALTRKHARVLQAAAAAEAADESPSIVSIAARVPLRADLVEIIAADLSTRGLLACSGEFPIDDDPQLPGPVFRVTGDGQRALSELAGAR